MSERELVEHQEVIDRVAGWFDLHARSLADYATRRVGAALARDVVSDTFRVALERAETFDEGRGDERAWLFGIATNLMRRHWRTEERRLRTQARSVRADVLPIDPLLAVERQVDNQQIYAQVIDAVTRLAPDDRDLLVLIAWEDMTSAQAAAVLGIPPGTVRSRLYRIRNHLAGHVFGTLESGATHG